MKEHLLFRCLVGRSTPAEASAVEAWREQSAENDRRYREMADLLTALKHAQPALDTTPPSPLKLTHLAESFASSGKGRTPKKSPRRPRSVPWRPWTAAAAALFGVAWAGTSLYTSGAETPGFQADEYVAGTSEPATVTLSDGTVVRLGPQSRLRMTSGSGRNVSLWGRAVFSVAKDPDRPFRIETQGGKVEVLGTRFAVEADADDLQVTVIEGRVALSARGQRTEVRAGQMRRVVAGATLPAVQVSHPMAIGDWVGDFLAFQDTPLEEAATEISRLYDVRIDIPDPVLAEQTITAWFSDQPLDQVMTILCMVAQADCTTADDGLITIRPGRTR